jgi:phospholipase/carboxylesterase
VTVPPVGSIPHGARRLVAGEPVASATSALVLLHGRGATAEDILDLGVHLRLENTALIAPQAHEFTWYPERFLAPLERNQPWLDAALATLSSIAADLRNQGLDAERVAWLGFSQGACLVSEWCARNPARRRGIFALTGGRIGPPGTDFSVPAAAHGSLTGTPAFFGCGDPDPHIPWFRVEETAASYRELGADVTVRRYPGAPHSVNADQVAFVRQALAR